jgi:hypothetical protein
MMKEAFNNSEILSDIWQARESGEAVFNKVYSFEEKNKLVEYIGKYNKENGTPPDVIEKMIRAPGLYATFIMEKNSGLWVDSWSGQKFASEEFSVSKRVAKVFEQAYVRFLDLQKAEAQSRESQIQLALERVRARTMAMQKSDELSAAVYVLFQQFKELGENPDQATIGVVNEEEWVIEYWVTMYGKQMDRVFKFSIDEPHVTNKIYKAWKRGDKSLVIDLSGKELYEFTTYRESMGGARRKLEEQRRVINVAFFSKGLLNVQSNEMRSNESIHLLERFALVFDQTYTRFLDLQKAEGQAREARIEAALEKVRARTMGMQHSDELKDAAALLFEQVKGLGVPAFSCGYNIWEKNEKFFTCWMSKQDGTGFDAVSNVPLTEDANFIRFATSRQKRRTIFCVRTPWRKNAGALSIS